ncbi:hypothetical protein [Demequina maris]|uniref:hypothetical protein n=1 Tax=Demequina maris TaxID=1638982 RepID=UPI000785F04E|nr:hypothetical protein [Demequina maris]
MTQPISKVIVDVDGVISVHAVGEDDLAHWPADSWQKVRVPVTWAGVTVDVTYSTRVIDGLRRIEALSTTSMMWCTTWRGDAASSLGPAIGLGADWPVADHDLPHEFEWMGWWKAARAYECSLTCDRVVWIDDAAAAWAANMYAADLGEYLRWLDDRVLIISPDLARGLTAEHLARIEAVLA